MIDQIIEKITETIVPTIDLWKVEFFDYIKDMETYCKQTVYQEAKGAANIYRLKEKKGYTKAMEKYFGRTPDDLKGLIQKDAEAKLAKINVAVNKKLAGIVVESVELIKFNMEAKDGFCEGAWLINGSKVFSFKVIYAGGYNIQRLHYRTIYKLTDI